MAGIVVTGVNFTPIINTMHVGTELRRIRKSRRETLANVSQETGYSASFLSVMERGQANPSLDTLKKLAYYYDVPVKQLLISGSYNDKGGVEAYRPGFRDFVSQVGDDLSDTMKDVLLYIDNASFERAQSKEDWMRRYYLLSSIVR